MIVVSIDVGAKNLAIVVLMLTELDEITVQSMKVYNLDNGNKKQFSTGDAVTSLVGLVYEQLDTFKFADYVLIESQMGDNVKMKVISHSLQSILTCMANEKKIQLQIKNIRFCSPANKLKVFKDLPLDENKLPTDPYRRKKKIAILHAQHALKEDLAHLECFNSHLKKDDLADALLQGYWFIDQQRHKVRSGTGKNRDMYKGSIKGQVAGAVNTEENINTAYNDRVIERITDQHHERVPFKPFEDPSSAAGGCSVPESSKIMPEG